MAKLLASVGAVYKKLKAPTVLEIESVTVGEEAIVLQTAPGGVQLGAFLAECGHAQHVQDWLVEIFQQVLEGITVLHASKLVHGGLGPDAVWVALPANGEAIQAKVGPPVLIFGLESYQQSLGTFEKAFQSPELVASKKPSQASDCYAVGVLICWAAAQCAQGTTQKVVQSPEIEPLPFQVPADTDLRLVEAANILLQAIPGARSLHGALQSLKKQKQLQQLQSLKACRCKKPAESIWDAARNNCVACVERYKENAGQRDKEGLRGTALMYAAKEGFIECCRVLAQREAGIARSNGQTALMLAAQHDQVEVTRLLAPLEAGKQDKAGWTALMQAAQNGCAECVEVLAPLEHGMAEASESVALAKCIVRGKNYRGQIRAARELWKFEDERLQLGVNIAEIVRQRLFVDAEIPCICQGQSSCLMAAAAENCLACCEKYIEEVKKRDDEGRTALMHGAAAGSLSAVEFLLSYEAGLKDRAGRTALMLAAENGCADCVQLLMAREKNMADGAGKTALQIAAQAPLEKGLKHEVLKLLQPYREERAILTELERKELENHFPPPQGVPEEEKVCTCKGRSQDLLEATEDGCMLCSLQYFSQTGMRGCDRQTPLMNAAFYGNLACVKFLAPSEARRTEQTGWTALMLATQEVHPEIVKVLAPLENGLKDKDGEVALAQTALEGHDRKEQKKCAETLWQYPAERRALRPETKELIMELYGLEDPDASIEEGEEDEQGACPRCGGAARDLAEAAKIGCPLCCKRFKEEMAVAGKKKQVVQDSDGKTPLHHAALANSADCVKLLSQDYQRIQDASGHTALMVAAIQGNVEAVRILAPLEKGCKAGTQTALVLAALGDSHSEAQRQCAEILKQHPEELQGLRDEDTQLLRGAYPTLFPAPQCPCKSKTLIQAVAKGCMRCCETYAKEAGKKDANGRTALMRAAQANQLEAVQFLLEKEAGAQDSKGESALMLAAAQGHMECAKLLMGKEAKLQAQDGSTALIKALLAKHFDVASALLEAEGGVLPTSGPSALMLAIQESQESLIAHLLPKEKGYQTKAGQTALMAAAAASRPDLVEALLQEEGGMETAEGVTALMMAAAAGDLVSLKLLLPVEKGCGGGANCGVLWTTKGRGPFEKRKQCLLTLLENVEEREAAGEAQLEEACRYFGIAVPKFTVYKCICAGAQSLFQAALNNCVACCRAKAAEAGRFNEENLTALMLAVQNKCIDVIPTLARLEAKLRTAGGKTALHLAVEAECTEAVTALCRRESKLKTDAGDTALHLAADRDWATGAAILGPKEPRILNAAGMTALMLAAKKGNARATEALFEFEKCFQRPDGHTALMIACRFGSAGCVKILKQRESRIVRPDGWTALMISARYGTTACTAELLTTEAQMTLKNGTTALMIAAQFGNVGCVKQLLVYEQGMKTTEGGVALRKTLLEGHDVQKQKECAKVLWASQYERPAIDPEARKKLKQKFGI